MTGAQQLLRSDVLVGIAFFALALLLRLPNLYLIPRWTDATAEAQFALRMARGEILPWQSPFPYAGPLYYDLLAAILRIVGSNPYLPRAFTAMMGALTVVAVWRLGASLADRKTGVIAALLMATAGTHIVTSSHIEYSNSVLPLFATLALLCFYRAVKNQRSLDLILGSAALAFAAQIHWTVFLLVPGILAWFLIQRQWVWFRRAGLYVALLTFGVIYSPVLVTVILHPESLTTFAATRSYAVVTDHTLFGYLGNLQNFLVELLRIYGAQFVNLSRPREYLVQPLSLAYALVLPLGLILATRHERGLLLLPTLSTIFILPYINRQYGDFPYFARYLMPIVPLGYIVAAWGLSAMLAQIKRLASAPIRWGGQSRSVCCLARSFSVRSCRPSPFTMPRRAAVARTRCSSTSSRGWRLFRTRPSCWTPASNAANSPAAAI
jgi:4-amino-4-deoxy-L-arabinose transferase-like glycosyltransferase